MYTTPAAADLIDSATAWRRLLVTLALMTVGAAGMYVVPVVLPAVQSDFGVARADAALPYTLLMVGFGLGGMLMGRLADRFGVAMPLSLGAIGMGLGFAAAALSGSVWLFALAHGLLIGLLGRFGRLVDGARQLFGRCGGTLEVAGGKFGAGAQVLIAGSNLGAGITNGLR